MSARPQDFESLALSKLRAKDYRITSPRLLVIRALATAEKALTAYEITDRVLSSGMRVDSVTVYRILATLEECGLLYRIKAFDGVFRRMQVSKHGGSALLVNRSDKSVVECEADSVLNRIAQCIVPDDMAYVGHQLEVEVRNA